MAVEVQEINFKEPCLKLSVSRNQIALKLKGKLEWHEKYVHSYLQDRNIGRIKVKYRREGDKAGGREFSLGKRLISFIYRKEENLGFLRERNGKS